MPLSIREATAADTEPLTPLMQAALVEQAEAAPHRYTPTADFELHFRRWLGHLFEDPRSTVLVAVDAPASPGPESELLGYLLASVQSTPPIFQPHEYALIHHLYVLPAHRRTGVARRLVAAATHFYASLNLSQLRVETYAANAPAQRFFESLDFHASTLTLIHPLNPTPITP
jgi:ribosomal protein S18 acetylase RimI-like enzyme